MPIFLSHNIKLTKGMKYFIFLSFLALEGTDSALFHSNQGLLSVFVPLQEVDCYITSQYQSAHTCNPLYVQQGECVFEGVYLG